MSGPAAPPRQPEQLMTFLRQYELVRCTKSTTPGEYNTRIVAYRRQKQVEDVMSARSETSAESIDRVHEKLKHDLNSMTIRQARELGRCFASPLRKQEAKTAQKVEHFLSIL